MPIEKTMTTPAGVTASFHKPLNAEISFGDNVAVIRMASWINEGAHNAGAPYVTVWPVSLPATAMADPEGAMLVSSTFAGGSRLPDRSGGIEARRARHWAFIKQQREQREYAGFTWDGSTFDSDPDARARIMGAVIEAQALGADFTRTWRLADNTLRVLDAKDMLDVGKALGAHVGQVFDIGNALYQQIQASDNPESISWPAGVETQLSSA